MLPRVHRAALSLATAATAIAIALALVVCVWSQTPAVEQTLAAPVVFRSSSSIDRIVPVPASTGQNLPEFGPISGPLPHHYTPSNFDDPAWFVANDFNKKDARASDSLDYTFDDFSVAHWHRNSNTTSNGSVSGSVSSKADLPASSEPSHACSDVVPAATRSNPGCWLYSCHNV